MSTAAQQEFNSLMASRERATYHPEDISEEDDGSDTLVDEATHKAKSKSSLRSSKFDGGNSSDADSDVEADARRLNQRRPGTYQLPKNYTYNANTGPKGVIADAQAFELEKSVGNKRTYVRTEDFVLPKNQRLEPGIEIDQDQDAEGGEDEDDYDQDADEDQVLRKWRESRVNELKKGMSKRRDGERRGRYGSLKVVDAMAFLETVESVPKQTIVVVYVFDDDLPISDAYHSHVVVLAAKYPHIKFIALHYEDAEMEHAGVPAILAYRDGDQFAGLVPLRNQVSFAKNVVTNMEEAFKRHGIL